MSVNLFASLDDDVQRLIWSWYILPLRVRMFVRMLMLEHPDPTKVSTLAGGRCILADYMDLNIIKRRETTYRGIFRGYDTRDGRYEYNAEIAVVYMGKGQVEIQNAKHEACLFAQYKDEAEDDKWSMRDDYAIVLGNRFELGYNDDWNAIVE